MGGSILPITVINGRVYLLFGKERDIDEERERGRERKNCITWRNQNFASIVVLCHESVC